MFGSVGDKFRFTNLISYRSKSEFYDIFEQDKCLRLDVKRTFIFTGSSKDYEKVDGRFVMKNNKI